LTERQLRAWTERDAKALARATEKRRLAEIRARLSAGRLSLRERTKATKASARAALVRVRTRAKELRVALRVASQAARELSRYLMPGARVVLGEKHREALATLAKEHEGLTHELSAEQARRASKREVQAMVREAEGRKRAGMKRRGTTARELRAERDDEVRQNIEGHPELLPAWEKWKAKFKGSRLRSRTEEFLEYVHDHANDAARIYEQAQEAAALAEPEESAEEYEARQREEARRERRAGAAR
jgi:hypothetical protein